MVPAVTWSALGGAVSAAVIIMMSFWYHLSINPLWLARTTSVHSKVFTAHAAVDPITNTNTSYAYTTTPPPSISPCLAHTTLPACVADRDCAWCLPSTLCYTRNSDECPSTAWCAQPYFTVNMELGGGYNNQKMAVLGALLLARRFHAVLVAPTFFARHIAEWPATQHGSSFFALPEYFDGPHFYYTVSPHVCVVPGLPEARGDPPWIKARPPLFKYVSKPDAAWQAALAPHVATANEIDLDYPISGYEASEPWAAEVYYAGLRAMRPPADHMSIVHGILACANVSAAVHLRIEADTADTQFSTRLPALGDLLANIRDVRGQRVYVVSGITRAALACGSCTAGRYIAPVCAIVTCVFKEDCSPTSIPTAFDQLAGIDYEILTRVPLAYLTRWSSLDWLAALVRQRDPALHHVFYDSAVAADGAADIQNDPKSFPAAIMARV